MILQDHIKRYWPAITSKAGSEQIFVYRRQLVCQPSEVRMQQWKAQISGDNGFWCGAWLGRTYIYWGQGETVADDYKNIKNVLIFGLLLNFVPLYNNHRTQTAIELTHCKIKREWPSMTVKRPTPGGKSGDQKKTARLAISNKTQEIQYAPLIFTWIPYIVFFFVCSQLCFFIGQLFAIQNCYSNYFFSNNSMGLSSFSFQENFSSLFIASCDIHRSDFDYVELEYSLLRTTIPF